MSAAAQAAAVAKGWLSADRAQDEEQVKAATLTPVTDHPLVPAKPKGITITDRTTSKTTIVTPLDTPADPLSALASPGASAVADPLGAAADPLGAVADPLGATAADPLSQLLTQAVSSSKRGEPKMTPEEEMMSTFTPWAAKKNGILLKYTTSSKLSITTSFLSPKDAPPVDKTRARLESLEDDDEDSVQTMLDLSQQDYVAHIEDLQRQLIAAWDADQRVKSLKIAIQNAKLLADPKPPQFYPSKFVLITEILDTFGNLVYDRIHKKSTYSEKGSNVEIPLPAKFTPEMVSDSAKETCKNWFYKIASIRELLPRIYVEMALLKCYNFLSVIEYDTALERLARMTRGIGNPLVATYCRAYLCRKGMEVAPLSRKHLLSLFDDFCFAYGQLSQEANVDFMAEYNLTYAQYLNLYVPALEWILQCVGHQSADNVLDALLKQYVDKCNNGMVLDCIMSSFEPQYVSAHALRFVQLIRNSDHTAHPVHQLYHTLGVNMVLAAPPKEAALQILKDVWRVVSKLENLADYIKCAEVYIEIPAKHLTAYEVDQVLGDVVAHLGRDRSQTERFLPQIQSMIEKILMHVSDFNAIFSMENIMPLVDLLQSQPRIRVEVCKSMMQHFARHQQDDMNDLLRVNSVLYIAKTLHDSVNALTFEDERRQLTDLILAFVRKVNYGRDFEAQLNFYVEARASFANLDGVLSHLVQAVNSLIVQTLRIVKGVHNRKTSAFVRAAVGYCYITIPSITSFWSRLSLYLLSARVALLNHCLPQAESLFRAAVALIADSAALSETELAGEREAWLVQYITNFTAALITLPGHPENGPFFVLKGLIQALLEFKWSPLADTLYEIFINILPVLATFRSGRLPYRIEGLESNDVLYDGDPRYFLELDIIIDMLGKQISGQIETLAASSDVANQQRRAHLALLTVSRVSAFFKPSTPPVLELLQFAAKHMRAAQAHLPTSETAFAKNTIAFLDKPSALYTEAQAKAIRAAMQV